jgi:Lrp/AsnC family transcriptional regulator, leucine-responsive regulatory protein
MVDMDTIDRKILTELQANCRITNVQLARLVGLSPAPCLRRLRQLEGQGTIIGYTAIVAPAAMGLGLASFVQVTLEKNFVAVDEAFQSAIANRPEVVGSYACAGDYDYLLKVLVPDHIAYARFLFELRRIAGVVTVKSALVIDATPELYSFCFSYSNDRPLRILPRSALPDAWLSNVRGIDHLDRRIVVELQSNARVSLLKLAKRTQLSPAGTLNRLHALESRGVICGYTAIVDPSALDLGIVALVGVTLEKGSNLGTVFETAMASRSEVAACFAVAGEVDYQIRVVASDIQTYARFLKDYLRRIPGVASTYSSFFLSPPAHLFAKYEAIEKIANRVP